MVESKKGERKVMSFSSEIKEELTKIVNKDENCKLAELAGFMITNCVVAKENDEFVLRMSTENASIIRRAYNSFKALYGITADTNIEKEKVMKDTLYQLKIYNKDDLEKIFKDSFININVAFQVVIDDKDVIRQDEVTIKAFLRGVFIGAGSVVNPNTRYHLEIVANNQDNALFINNMIQKIGIIGKIIKRKKAFVIYLKGAESISIFLAAIGANRGMLTFEETRVIKEMRNKINRLNNFENANFDKTLDASLSQLEDIRIIKKNRKFEKMPEPLKQLARLRMTYKEATLEELGNMLEPKLSRAGVSHRFKKIKQIADAHRDVP